MNIVDKLMKIDAGTLETPKAVHKMFVTKVNGHSTSPYVFFKIK